MDSRILTGFSLRRGGEKSLILGPGLEHFAGVALQKVLPVEVFAPGPFFPGGQGLADGIDGGIRGWLCPDLERAGRDRRSRQGEEIIPEPVGYWCTSRLRKRLRSVSGLKDISVAGR